MLLLALAALAMDATPAPDWRASMAAGDCPAVVAALSAPTEGLERLAGARCLERLGQDGRAVEVVQGADAAEPGLAPYVALVKARALLDRDRPDEAAAALRDVALPGTEEELLRGRALVLAGKGLEARDGLRALLGTPVGDEARWWLARGAELREDREAALAAYRALWSKAPTSVWAAKAAERLEAMGAGVPDLATAEGRDLAMVRVKRLLELRQAGEAVKLLDLVNGRAPAADPAAELFVANALFDAKLYARAVEAYQRAGATTASPAAAFSLALATARSGDYPNAALQYDALARRFPGTPQAEEARWKIPYMDYDAGRFDDAARGLAAYLASYPNGKFAADARWFAAWGRWRNGDVAGALRGFDDVARAHPGSELAIGARYWKARATDDLAALRDLLRQYPDSGYAFYAAERLGVRYPPVPDAQAPAFPDAFLAGKPDLALGVRLARAGLGDWARPLLAAHVPAAKAAGKDAALAMAWALIDAEDYRGAKALAAPYCATGPVAAQACTPRPHAGAVEAVARDHGLPPLLPYAIMNAESGLDPSVTSPAGARGIMQLMPALALELAKDRAPGFVPDDLYLAGVSSRLGTAELGLLYGRFARSPVAPRLPLVIAGYNGGGDAVERWLGTYATPPDGDRFAEDISFTETRRYVRRVLGYLMQYRRVYGDRS